MFGTERCALSLCYVLAAYLVASVISLRRPSDTVLLAKCSASCTSSNQDREHNQCVKECMSAGWKDKPGQCPKEADVYALACIKECSSDRECHGIDKCCPHSCGVTCKTPMDLLNAPGLPELPTDVKLTERKKSNVCVVTWTPSPREGPKTLYIVQERHSPGQVFRVETMGPWRQAHKVPKIRPRAKLVLRRGNWYQIRVAAISANGTRGFSQPTHQFILSQNPKAPDAPTYLTFKRTTRRNGSVSGLLSWDPPLNSDLPLLRYNVLWSKRAPTVYQQTKKVSGDKTSIKIKNLSVNSVYDFQIEAVTQYGREKLTSDKGILQVNITDSGVYKRPQNEKSNQKHMTIQLSRPILQGGKLNYRLSWKSTPAKPFAKFALTWESECGQAKTTKNVVIESSQYEMTGLKFSCRYTVRVREKSFGRKSKRGGKITFTSASCTEFDPPAC